MTRQQLEKKILQIWMESRIPISLAHLQYATGAEKSQIDTWLDELVVEGTIDMAIEPTGDIYYTVPGARRPKNGATTFAQWKATRSNKPKGNKPSSSKQPKSMQPRDFADLAGALELARKTKNSLTEKPGAGEKSIPVSAGLSLLGPVGWLYAGSLKEAVPAAAIAVVLGYFLPSILLMPLLMVGIPASVVVGMLYGWQHKKYGRRMPLLLSDPEDVADE